MEMAPTRCKINANSHFLNIIFETFYFSNFLPFFIRPPNKLFLTFEVAIVPHIKHDLRIRKKKNHSIYKRCRRDSKGKVSLFCAVVLVLLCGVSEYNEKIIHDILFINTRGSSFPLPSSFFSRVKGSFKTNSPRILKREKNSNFSSFSIFIEVICM